MLKQLCAFILTSLTLFLFVASSALPAHALDTYVINYSGKYVPMQFAPTSAYNNVKHWIPNGTKFEMRCWTDWQWYTGNYRTNRWFWGQTYDDGEYGYVNASYVKNQTRVPGC